MKKIYLALFLGLLFTFHTSVFAQEGDNGNTIELTDYGFCVETLNGYEPDLPSSCTPLESKFYGRNCDQCCSGTTYDTYSNGNAKMCCEGEVYDSSDAGYSPKCCNGKSQFIVTDGPDQGKGICCDYGTIFTGGYCVSCELLTTIPSAWQANCIDVDVASCAKEQKYTDLNGVEKCCPGEVVDSQENPGTQACIINTEGTVGLTMNADCLINGQCSYNIYETLGIRKSDPDPSVGSFVQDIVLAVTMFIGTVVAIVLVVSGILYILSSIRGSTSQAEMAKKGIVNSIMGLILVVSSYAIVRLVQFLATAGGG